jgi:hypothetical protein
MDARTAFASAIGEEMDRDLDPEFMGACDKVLMRLYLYGYIVSEAPPEVAEEVR